VDDASIAPALLVAMPQLLDPNFHRSVVLLVHQDDEGSFGVVLNRGTGIPIARLCEGLEIEWAGDPAQEIGWGGPVQPQSGWALFGAAPELEGAELRDVAPGLHFAELSEALVPLAARPPEAMRLVLGYSGWGPGQLESELAQGAWLIAPVEPRAVFEVPPEEMWAAVVRGLGVEPATLVAGRGVH